jgi:hypothetical protein
MGSPAIHRRGGLASVPACVAIPNREAAGTVAATALERCVPFKPPKLGQQPEREPSNVAEARASIRSRRRSAEACLHHKIRR